MKKAYIINAAIALAVIAVERKFNLLAKVGL